MVWCDETPKVPKVKVNHVYKIVSELDTYRRNVYYDTYASRHDGKENVQPLRLLMRLDEDATGAFVGHHVHTDTTEWRLTAVESTTCVPGATGGILERPNSSVRVYVEFFSCTDGGRQALLFARPYGPDADLQMQRAAVFAFNKGERCK